MKISETIVLGRWFRLRSPIVFPPTTLIAKFNAHAQSLLRQIEVLSERIQNLRRTRNLLLPRLLSGQIDVEALAA